MAPSPRPDTGSIPVLSSSASLRSRAAIRFAYPFTVLPGQTESASWRTRLRLEIWLMRESLRRDPELSDAPVPGLSDGGPPRQGAESAALHRVQPAGS